MQDLIEIIFKKCNMYTLTRDFVTAIPVILAHTSIANVGINQFLYIYRLADQSFEQCYKPIVQAIATTNWSNQLQHLVHQSVVIPASTANS